MADVHSPRVRSRNMAAIRGKDTRPELLIRKALHRRGLRYVLHDRRLPGRPDLVFPRYRTVLFVHGCFWHRHSGCRFATTPASNTGFWQKKLDENVQRDRKVRKQLQLMGWRVLTIWECRVAMPECIDDLARKIATSDQNH